MHEYREDKEEADGEDEDSNDEDNSRNEYPEEEEDSDSGSYGGYCDEDGLGGRIQGMRGAGGGQALCHQVSASRTPARRATARTQRTGWCSPGAESRELCYKVYTAGRSKRTLITTVRPTPGSNRT
jgi:hypothetical protein